MATLLHWKAYELKDRIFDRYLSPFKISMTVETESFVFHQNSKKLLDFYLGFLSIILHSLCYLIITLRFLLSHNIVPLYKILFYVELTGIWFTATALNYLTITHGQDLFSEYCNSLFQYDRILRKDKRKLGYTIGIGYTKSLIAGKFFT